MPYRRFRRSSFGRRRRRRYQWARFQATNINPSQGPTVNADDLLSPWRTAAGVTLNLPEFTIWRIHIKVSIFFSWSPATVTSNSGASFALLVDSLSQAPLSALANPYEESFMMWDYLYGTEQLFQGAGAAGTLGDNVLYRMYDVRSRRRLRNAGDTLWAINQGQGNVSLTNYSYTASVLLSM